MHMETTCPMRHAEEPIRVVVRGNLRYVVVGREAILREEEDDAPGW